MTHMGKLLCLSAVLIATVCLLIGAVWYGSNVRWYGSNEALYRGLVETFQHVWEK